MTGQGAGVRTGHKKLHANVSLWQEVDCLMCMTKVAETGDMCEITDNKQMRKHLRVFSQQANQKLPEQRKQCKTLSDVQIC